MEAKTTYEAFVFLDGKYRPRKKGEEEQAILRQAREKIQTVITPPFCTQGPFEQNGILYQRARNENQMRQFHRVIEENLSRLPFHFTVGTRITYPSTPTPPESHPS